MKITTRNPVKVLESLSNLPGKPVIAKTNLVLQIPVRFTEIDLAQIGSSTFIFGFAAIILETGEYAVLSVNAFLEAGPAIIDKVEIKGVEYFNFHFQAGDVVFKTKELVCRAALIFRALKEFVFNGKIPWYASYDDVGKLFDTAKKHSKTRAEILPSVNEFMAAYIARDKDNRIKFLRETARTRDEFIKKLAWVPMKSVFWSAPGTVNKIAGAYFQDGIVSAMVNPSDQTEKIESILRA